MTRCYIAVILFLAFALTASAQVGVLPRSTPEAEGVHPAVLKHFYSSLAALPDVDIHHIMVLRNGKVISEHHATPYQAEQLHTLYSASKTVTALAVGLAVDDGLLTVDDKVSKYLRDKMPATLSPALDSLTVRNLLMMGAGREPDLDIFMGEEDWLTVWFVGEFQGVGQCFKYDSMCTHALAAIVTRLTGKSLLDYVSERIFAALHIVEADWELAPDSVEAAGWGLRLQAESEAKLGLLMLNGGQWNGMQLVSQQWIHDMTQPLISTREAKAPELSFGQKVMAFLRSIWHSVRSWFTGYNVDDYYLGYGYQTKVIQHPRADSFFATGYGGQLIYAVPKLDLLVVVNGRAANYGDELNTIYYTLVEPLIAGDESFESDDTNFSIEPPQGEASHPLENGLLDISFGFFDEDNLLGLHYIRIVRSDSDLIFTMNDYRGPLRAVAACGQWRITTSDDRPIYIMESREQLVGTRRPFTTAAAYAWQGDTLVMRMDWLDGGDNRRLKIHPEGTHITVIANDNFDPLLTDTIRGEIVEID